MEPTPYDSDSFDWYDAIASRQQQVDTRIISYTTDGVKVRLETLGMVRCLSHEIVTSKQADTDLCYLGQSLLQFYQNEIALLAKTDIEENLKPLKEAEMAEAKALEQYLQSENTHFFFRPGF